MADDRVIVPRARPGSASPHGGKEDVGNDRLLTALQNMDANTADRLKDLKLFLFFLPLIWGVVWGLLWFLLLLALRSQ